MNSWYDFFYAELKCIGQQCKATPWAILLPKSVKIKLSWSLTLKLVKLDSKCSFRSQKMKIHLQKPKFCSFVCFRSSKYLWGLDFSNLTKLTIVFFFHWHWNYFFPNWEKDRGKSVALYVLGGPISISTKIILQHDRWWVWVKSIQKRYLSESQTIGTMTVKYRHHLCWVCI